MERDGAGTVAGRTAHPRRMRSDMSEYWWCLTHGRVEQGDVCKSEDRLGPYPTEEAAASWRTRHETREETWEEEDERWHGEDDD